MADFDVIEATGQTIQIGSGEEFSNKIIDATAAGASFRIEANGDDWAIRNVGIRGTLDQQLTSHEQAIRCRVPSASSSATIENLYFADGIADSTYPGLTGIYVRESHAGTLNIKNVNIQGAPNHAIFANHPGGAGGAGGEVHISDSIAKGCLSAHFRVGSSGSSVTNCVAANGDRGVWVTNGDVEVSNCDLYGHATNRADGDLVVGRNSGETSAVANVSNTYFGTSAPGDQGINSPGTINGQSTSSQGNASPNAPTSAKEAASRSASGGGGGGGGGPGGLDRRTLVAVFVVLLVVYYVSQR